MTARLSFDTACGLGFRGSLDECESASWEQLRGGERLPFRSAKFYEREDAALRSQCRGG
jgi:hypothetical protein